MIKHNDALKILNLIHFIISGNHDAVYELIGYTPLDNTDLSKDIVASKIGIFLESIKGGVEFFSQKIEVQRDSAIREQLYYYMGFTNEFDLMKKFIDEREKRRLKSQSKIALLRGLARSEKYSQFVKDQLSISDSNDKKVFLQIGNESTILILKSIKDLDFIDSIVKSCNPLIPLESATPSKFNYRFNPIDLARIIANTDTPEYITKYYLDDEWCKKSKLGLDEKVVLAIGTKNPDIILEYFKDEKLRSKIPPEQLRNMLLATSDYTIIKDAIINPNKYGLEPEMALTLILKANIPLIEVKNSTIFNSPEGQRALALAFGDESLYETYKEYKGEISIPEEMTVGIEIECAGLFSPIVSLIKYINGWKAKPDFSIYPDNQLGNGVEVVSPILTGNNSEITKSIKNTAGILSKLGLYANYSCGGHVHIGASYLKSQLALNTLFELWNNNERIFYIISNDEGEATRDSVGYYAFPISKGMEDNKFDEKFQKAPKKGLSKFKKKFNTKRRSLYLDKDKNTLEFRISNGTLNPKTWIENVNLYGNLVKVSQDLAVIQTKAPGELTPQEAEKLAIFDRLGTDKHLSESEKTVLLMKLIFDDERSRAIYYRRYKTNSKLFNNSNIESTLSIGLSEKTIRYTGRKIGADLFTGKNALIGPVIEEIDDLIAADEQTLAQEQLEGN